MKKTIKFSAAVAAALMAIAPLSGSFTAQNNVVQASSSKRLTRNAVVYNAKGKRVGRKILKKGSTVRILGKKGSFYRVGKNAYVKIGNFKKKTVRHRVTSANASASSQGSVPNEMNSADQEFINLLNNYRAKHGKHALTTADPSWLKRGSEIRFREFVNTFNKKGTIDNHVRPNGSRGLSVFGKRSVRASENEGEYMSSDPASGQAVAKFLFDQFMYHDSAAHWEHRDNLANPKAKYISVHFAQIKRGDGYYYVVIAHTGR